MGAGVMRVAMGGGVWWAHRAVVFSGLVGCGALGAWGSTYDAKVRQLSARAKFGCAAACYFLLIYKGLRVNSS